jgi:hypothetical protein
MDLYWDLGRVFMECPEPPRYVQDFAGPAQVRLFEEGLCVWLQNLLHGRPDIAASTPIQTWFEVPIPMPHDPLANTFNAPLENSVTCMATSTHKSLVAVSTEDNTIFQFGIFWKLIDNSHVGFLDTFAVEDNVLIHI